jgi:FdhE protein
VTPASLVSAPTAESLAAEHPEWSGWLALLRAVDEEAATPAWQEAVSRLDASRVPRLLEASMEIERAPAERWVRRLFSVNDVAGLGEAATRIDAFALIRAALEMDDSSLSALARDAHAPLEAFGAVAPLAALPWLTACGRRLAAGAEAPGGWCPVCGAWAGLAEARGLERERRLRCIRCGADWRTQWLACPFCGNDDHRRLPSLVADSTGETRKVDACAACRGYVKTVTTLAAADTSGLRLLDLATVDLDVAALERSFERPRGLGHPLRVRVAERPVRRFWRR